MKSKLLQNGPTWEAVLSYVEAGGVVVGIDEVGRGACAGPVVAGAVILPPRLVIDGLRDSKLLSAAQRTVIDQEVRRVALAVGLGWVTAGEVDEHGLTWAVRESGVRALAQLGLAYDVVILDGKHNYLAATHQSVAFVKADQLVVPVAAGSVVAKVARDEYMTELEWAHPGYGFAAHKGYGTAAHLEALRKLGPSPVHRRSYAPVAAAAKGHR